MNWLQRPSKETVLTVAHVGLRILRHPLIVFILGYTIYCGILGGIGLVTRGQSQMWTELPLLCALFTVSYNMLRPSRYRTIVASLPFLLVYLIHDYHQLMFASVPEWIDF